VSRVAPPIALGLVALLVAGISSGALARIEGERRTENALLYLPNGKHLELASLGHQGVVADAIYLWAIQYYANYERGDRYRYVEHVFRDVIAELDPHYVDAYWLGALILTLEARDLDGGLRLLDHGFAKNPEQWILPYLAGWECHFAGRYDRAAEYFRVAAGIPGAPPHVRRAIGGMMARAGNLEAALAEWRTILEDATTDPASRSIAERQVRELKLKIDLGRLREAIAAFQRDNGRAPAALSQLVRGGYIDAVPVDPNGEPYLYDPSSGRVASTAGRVLGERS
jgi:tetratricopeptide (TPR) repeat protein